MNQISRFEPDISRNFFSRFSAADPFGEVQDTPQTLTLGLACKNYGASPILGPWLHQCYLLDVHHDIKSCVGGFDRKLKVKGQAMQTYSTLSCETLHIRQGGIIH